MPPLPRCVKDKRERQLSDADLETVPKAIDTVVKWLDRLATALMVHHTTKEYETAVRKAGHERGKTGLTEAEQETRAAIRRAKRDIRTAKFLAAEWETHWVMPGLEWQKNLLQDYWTGALHRRLEAVSGQGSGHSMCRSPLLLVTPRA